MEERPRLAGGDGLDAPGSGADGPLAHDRERADLGGRAHVRAAAELAREAVDLDDAHLLPVLLAEEHHRAELARLLDRSDERAHGDRLEDLLVDDSLDSLPLRGRQRLRVGEIEAELVGTHGGSSLLDVVAEYLPKRRVQQMRRRVVRHRREPDRPRHNCPHPCTSSPASVT